MPPPPTQLADGRPVARPLAITSDVDLLDDLVRLAAAAGAELDVAHDPGSARRLWSSAPVVVVGADVAAACVRSRLPRRTGVVLVGDDLDDAGVWQTAVSLGAEHVVFLPDAERWLTETLTDALEVRAEPCPVVTVVGGRGGAGATTLACALAVTAARAGSQVLLVDADPLGGGIDLALGGEDRGGLRWPDLAETVGRVPSAALLDALPETAGLQFLSWHRGRPASAPADAVSSVLSAGRLGSDLVVVDLPRALDDSGLAVLAQAATTLLVVPAEVRAAAAAARVATQVCAVARDVRLVVRGPAPTGLSADEIARTLALPLAAELRPEPGLAVDLDRGEAPARRGRGPLAETCSELLADLLHALPGAA